MHATIDKLTVLRLLKELRLKDFRRKIFGSNGHDYELFPPLPFSEIEAFEKRKFVALPEDYKTFLTQVGNGGWHGLRYSERRAELPQNLVPCGSLDMNIHLPPCASSIPPRVELTSKNDACAMTSPVGRE